jgi:hypothetical protein
MGIKNRHPDGWGALVDSIKPLRGSLGVTADVVLRLRSSPMSIDLKPSCPVANRFLQDLKLSGASPQTQQSYVRAMWKFTEFLGHSRDLASEDQLRNYLLFLVDSKKWQPSTINVAQQALKRFFRVTCPKDWAVLKLARVHSQTADERVLRSGCHQQYLGHKHLISTMICLHITTVWSCVPTAMETQGDSGAQSMSRARCGQRCLSLHSVR